MHSHSGIPNKRKPVVICHRLLGIYVFTQPWPKADVPIDVLTYDVFKRQADIVLRQHGGVGGLDVFDKRNKAPFIIDFVLSPFPAATIAVQEQL